MLQSCWKDQTSHSTFITIQFIYCTTFSTCQLLQCLMSYNKNVLPSPIIRSIQKVYYRSQINRQISVAIEWEFLLKISTEVFCLFYHTGQESPKTLELNFIFKFSIFSKLPHVLSEGKTLVFSEIGRVYTLMR